MKLKYEDIKLENGKTFIKRTDVDGAESWIPTDPANSDYQAYLAANSGSSVPNDPLAPTAKVTA